MEENNTTTILDILTDVSKILNEVTIPMSAVESIGIPVARAINGIQLCIDAITNSEREKAEKDKPAEEGSEEDA